MMKRPFVRTFGLCLIIVLIVATGLTYNDPEHWREHLLSSLIFTFCIGYSIHTLTSFFLPRIARLPTALRLGLLLVLFLAGGFAGTEVGVGIHYAIFTYSVDLHDHLRLLTFNLILSAIFGTVAVTYFTLRGTAEHMAAKLKEKELNEERLMRLKTEAELQALQSKINPHFLFNTLNSIASLIAENPKAAEATVEKLSELFRYTLKNAENSTVTLAEELEVVRTYLEIEKVRFGDRLQYEITCDDHLRDFRMPALIIEPLVENSVKHGIAKQVNGGKVLVAAKEMEGKCVIAVEDNGKGFQEGAADGGFGLRSVEERLRLRYGEGASLLITGDDHTRIVITIPLL